jgi:transglutaminase-like putative cysteine protease
VSALHGPRRNAWLWLAVPALGAGLLVLHDASADGAPVLHEFIEHFVGQELPGAARATPPAAATPTANTSASGPAGEANDDGAAGAEQGGSEFGADTFRIDSDTSRPDNVRYSDPFTPEVAPFKRSIAYDAVDADFELFVSDRHLVPVGRSDNVTPTTEAFHAALDLSLNANQPLRIPTVGPGARVRVAHTDPSVAFQIMKDSAENWFVQSPDSRAVRLVLQIAVDRRSFGTPLPHSSYAVLAAALPAVPDIVKDNAREVAELLGVPKAARPRDVIGLLVDHFRRFRPSERRFAGRGASLYRQLAISSRGVCRHRAYAFVVTALGLGIPSRFVHNEAHAWVEVFDGQLWQRIDLGGAAQNLELDTADRPRHVQPRDPFAWPAGSDPASDMVDRSLHDRASAPAGNPPGSNAPNDAPASDAPASNAPGSEPAERGGVDDDDTEPGSAPNLAPEPQAPSAPTPPAQGSSVQLSIDTSQGRALRGEGFEVSGSVAVAERACPQVQVEVALKPSTGAPVALGTLLTDDRGRFSGRLALPWSLPLGDYTLSAESPQAARGCEP